MVEPSEVVTQAENARDMWDAATRSLAEVSFDFESTHPALGLSLDEFSKGLSMALELGATSNLQMNSDLVAMLNTHSALEGLKSSAEQINAEAQAVVNFFNSANQQSAKIQVVNQNTLKDTKNRQLNLAQHFKQLKTAAAQYIGKLALVHDFLLDAEMSDLASRIKRFRETGSAIEKLLAESQKNFNQIALQRDEANSAVATATSHLEQIEQTRTKAQEIQSAAEKIQNEADTKLASIRETTTQSDTLREKVEQFDTQFTTFDDALQKRLKIFTDFEESTKKAATDNRAREEKIDQIITKANEMLQGATNAGLAKSFRDASDEYKKSASKAKNFFYFSIVLVAISAVPLANYVFPIPFIDSVLTVERGSITLGGIIARAVLLLPTIWLTTFAAHRYTDLFQLHREYSFKAAIAMSVEGFKQQAPKYEEEIAGATFFELSQKPEYSPAKKNAASPNPIMAFWIKTMQKRFDSLSGND